MSEPDCRRTRIGAEAIVFSELIRTMVNLHSTPPSKNHRHSLILLLRCRVLGALYLLRSQFHLRSLWIPMVGARRVKAPSYGDTYVVRGFCQTFALFSNRMGIPLWWLAVSPEQDELLFRGEANRVVM